MTDQPFPDFPLLEPARVWSHFATLCRIPRPSKREDALRAHLLDWAASRGLGARVDGAGNLLLTKPATRGRESVPTVVLQAHLDMVCQKNSGSLHDFLADPIRPVVRDGWLVAEETTLGADNGIGAALILAALEEESLAHGPLEALLTVDEEDGMGGARGLSGDLLQARLMLNLDTEAWGEFYLGCSGGLDIDVSRPGRAEALPEGHAVWRISLTGLRGGHSGVDIHEERGNAIKLLTRILRDLESRLPLRLVSLEGGSARNALPREAFATLALPGGASPEDLLAHWQERLREELQGVDDHVRLEVARAEAESVMSAGEQAVWLASLHAAPHGVWRMSRGFPGVVETSNNLGMVRLGPEGGSGNLLVRSLIESGAEALADEIVSLFSLSGTVARKSGGYPGWKPEAGSRLLALGQAVYRERFGGESAVKVIHAGLECGLIGAKYPGMDMLSFGPTIRGAHAPGECVDIASVARCWELLKALLEAIPADAN